MASLAVHQQVGQPRGVGSRTCRAPHPVKWSALPEDSRARCRAAVTSDGPGSSPSAAPPGRRTEASPRPRRRPRGAAGIRGERPGPLHLGLPSAHGEVVEGDGEEPLPGARAVPEDRAGRPRQPRREQGQFPEAGPRRGRADSRYRHSACSAAARRPRVRAPGRCRSRVRAGGRRGARVRPPPGRPGRRPPRGRGSRWARRRRRRAGRRRPRGHPRA